MAINVFQIFYDEDTRKTLDPGFLPLDNSTAARPDWLEYWPIRTVLLNRSFADTDYVGFLSPRFFEKTGFRGAQVTALVERSGAEVVAFSPNFTQIALYQNTFFQGDRYQSGLLGVSQDLFAVMGLPINLKDHWADQTRSIFANYFVAKYRFWKSWFSCAEKIFAICETEKTPLAARLTGLTQHRDTEDKYQMKAFIMERLVNALLAARNINAASNFNFPHQRDLYNAHIQRLGQSPVDFGKFLLLDALKGAFIKTGQPQYRNLFRHHLSAKQA